MIIVDDRDGAKSVDYKTLSQEALKRLAGIGDAEAIEILESQRKDERTV